MNNDDVKNKQVLFVATAIVIAGVFSYGFYAVMGVVSSAQGEYIAKYEELTTLEEKQRQAKRLEEELAENAQKIEEVKKALIKQTYENKLRLVIDIENTAKAAGVVYELSIVKEVTAESIFEEKSRETRARRKSAQIREELGQEQFPSIIFNLDVSGNYADIVNFIERLQKLPYYTNIDSLNISSKRLEGEQGGAVEALMQFAVFTM